ncbi:hypothetical protein PYCC9005_004748 [Savitreella phatthalungensis]
MSAAARLVDGQDNNNQELDDSDFVGAEIGDTKEQGKLGRIFGGWDVYRQPEQAQACVGYLEGLKGVFAFEAFLWVFLRVIVPGATFEGLQKNGTSPRYESVLREILSPIFWDGSLQAGAFVILATRICCIRFLTNKDSISMAGTLFRRGIRLFVPVIVTLALVVITEKAGAYKAIARLRDELGNKVIEEPYPLDSALQWFNASFNIFWWIDGLQAGVKAFPTEQLWIVSVVYQQSYTVYMLAIMIPYTTKYWRFWGLILFSALSWWLTSWAWYGVTGLILAELATSHNLNARLSNGFSLPKTSRKLPFLVLPLLSLAIGIVLKYVYEVAEPNKINNELVFHTPIYGGGLNRDFSVNQPQQRASTWFMLVGIFLIVEAMPGVQRFFANPVFRYLGRISFGLFLTQGILMYSAGVRLYVAFVADGHMARPLAQLVVFAIMTPVCFLAGDIYARLVDNPSKWFANELFDYFRRP